MTAHARRLRRTVEVMATCGLVLPVVPTGCSRGTTDLAVSQLPKQFTNSIGMKLILAPPGEFQMGADPADSNLACPASSPAHRVRLTKPFYIAAYEVTQDQYKTVMAAHFAHPVPPFFSEAGGGRSLVDGVKLDQAPIDNVTGTLAAEFCRRLSDLPAEKAAGRVYRLPTEAEWEYACRGGPSIGASRSVPMSYNRANFNGPPIDGVHPLGRIAEVGSYPPNPLGLYDMQGNVWEWCEDGLREYTAETQIDPRGPSSPFRVLKGGAWDTPEQFCQPDFRAEGLSGYVFGGIRVACDVSE